MTYNAQEDLNYIEKNIYKLAYSVGLNITSLDSLTIDDLMSALKNIVKIAPIRSDKSKSDVPEAGIYLYIESPEYLYLRAQKIALVRNIRRFWYLRQLAIGAINRG